MTLSKYSEGGGCGGAEHGGTGNGVCLDEPEDLYYCACPEGEQIKPWENVNGEGAHHCEPCSSGGCVFQLEGTSRSTTSERKQIHRRHRGKQVRKERCGQLFIKHLCVCVYVCVCVYLRHLEASMEKGQQK